MIVAMWRWSVSCCLDLEWMLPRKPMEWAIPACVWRVTVALTPHLERASAPSAIPLPEYRMLRTSHNERKHGDLMYTANRLAPSEDDLSSVERRFNVHIV